MTSTTIGKPRGLLLPALGDGVFSYERHAPAGDLAPFIEHFWTVAWDCGDQPVEREVLPHPSVHVTIERGRSGVAGVPRGRFTRRLEGQGRVFGIKFAPGGFRPFVSFAIASIAGRVISLVEILGERALGLERSVLARTEMPAMIALATDFLRERLPPRDPRADEARAIVRTVLDDREIRTVEDLAQRCDSRPRALQRLFHDYVGVSPKWVIRRYRLHEAIERVNAGGVIDWTALALELGYFDQPHFIRDFKTLVGRTPADYGCTARSVSALR